MQYFKSLDFNRQFTQFNKNKKKVYNEKLVPIPFFHFPFSPEIHVYSSNFFMLIHGKFKYIYFIFLVFFTIKGYVL